MPADRNPACTPERSPDQLPDPSDGPEVTTAFLPGDAAPANHHPVTRSTQIEEWHTRTVRARALAAEAAARSATADADRLARVMANALIVTTSESAVDRHDPEDESDEG